MWFRFSGGNDVASSTESNNNLSNNNNNNHVKDGSAGGDTFSESSSGKPFEKFRRASFRRKSNSIKNSMPPKRSNSPHSLLRNDVNQVIEEKEESSDAKKPSSKKKNIVVFEEENNNPMKKENGGGFLYKNEVNIPFNPIDGGKTTKKTKATKERLLKEENKSEKSKKVKKKNSNKIWGTDKTTISCKDQEAMPSQNIPTKTQNFLSSIGLKSQSKYSSPLGSKDKKDDDPNEDDESSDSSESSDDSDSSDNCHLDDQDKDDVPQRSKSKLLLIDPKYRNNRIEKSSSKTRVSDIEKRESIKRSRSARKIMAPSSLASNDSSLKTSSKSSKIQNKSSSASHANHNNSSNTEKRQNSNLNLQSLVKFVMNQKKFVTTEDCALLQKKSIADAVSSVMAMASSCKQMPIALKYPQAGIVADTPKENDAKGERNVVLVKKQNLPESFFRGSLRLKNTSSSQKKLKPDDLKIKRNESTSSRSSGNFEDEAFYSFDESDNRKSLDSEKFPTIEEKSSPSLTSRMAAKFNEKTNIYKSRKARSKKQNSLEENKEIYRQNSESERLSSSSIVRQPSDRRPDANSISLRSNGNTSGVLNSSDLQNSFNCSGIAENTSCANSSITDSSASTIPSTGNLAGCVNNNVSVVDSSAPDFGKGDDARRERYSHQHNKSAPVSVSRSESCNERKKNRNDRRKTSDPNLSSRPKDEQSDNGLSRNYIASSNSSPSPGASCESLNISMDEHVGNATTPHANTSHVHHHGHQDSFHGSIGSAGSNNISFWGGNNSIGGPEHLTRQCNFDSDDSDDQNEADWGSMVAAETLATLTDAEKKRQEIINEIYQTERSHVRTLKLLDQLFFRNLQGNGLLPPEHLALLFPPALLSLCELHGAFEQKLRQRRLEHNHVVQYIGDLLASMFDGPAGENLMEFAAQFCARQQIALEALKERRRKDENLQKLLNKVESHRACRRLQLKDLLPTVLQRLTKYPLLFENLHKVTIRVLPENINEAELIQQALESSKKILVDVNQAVKTAEDAHKLQNIQKKLDKSTFDKEKFKNLDLTQYKLIYDGNLYMKKNPGVQLHGLLFDSMIVLLTKQDDKYFLKYLQTSRNTEVHIKPVEPIMSIDSDTLVRQEAADKNSFFLIKTKTSQMLELRAPSSSDCKTWFKHISDAAEQYKSRSKNVTQESVDDPAIATLPHSNTKDSLELQLDSIPPHTATATVITTPLAPFVTPQTPVTPGGSTDEAAINLQNGLNELSDAKGGAHDYYNIGNNRLAPNDLLQSNSVNRTLSTRSCGEAVSSPRNDNSLNANNVTLRHTQSARQANGSASTNNNNRDDFHKRDSASIVYSNNSNDTRTLLMQSPLVQPTAIQISISPAHTAEPVLTSSERLRRLDASIKDGLMEKQKIVCDMFRVPFEHFDEIVDIASMPEAPKDSADIALAAYNQIQNLTRAINDYLHVSPEQVISAVSTSVCDKCNELQNQNQKQNPSHSLCVSSAGGSGATKNLSSNPPVGNISKALEQNGDLPPPLPPPNKQTSHQLKKQKKQQHQQQHLSQKLEKKVQPKVVNVVPEDNQIHEDDDGYCEIDELRLPNLPPSVIRVDSPSCGPPPLPPPSGSFKPQPPLPPPPSPKKPEAEAAPTQESTQNLLQESCSKRQSIIIEESIPEKLENINEVTEKAEEETPKDSEEKKSLEGEDNKCTSPLKDEEKPKDSDSKEVEGENENENQNLPALEENQTTSQENDATLESKPEEEKPKVLDEKCVIELQNQAQMNDNMEQILTEEKSLAKLMVDGSTQTLSSALSLNDLKAVQCGPNRLQHVSSLEPQMPCLVVYNIVSALNEHISLLLPKLNERDQEREQLRKENQHLRELLNAMHERQRSNQEDESLTKPEEGSQKKESASEQGEEGKKEEDSSANCLSSEQNSGEPTEPKDLEAKD